MLEIHSSHYPPPPQGPWFNSPADMALNLATTTHCYSQPHRFLFLVPVGTKGENDLDYTGVIPLWNSHKAILTKLIFCDPREAEKCPSQNTSLAETAGYSWNIVAMVAKY